MIPFRAAGYSSALMLSLPDKLFMCVALYVDETGTHDPTGRERGSVVAGVGGYLSWMDDWLKLTDEWQEVLGAYGVNDFHFKEFAAVNTWGPHKKGWPYKGWEPKKRDEFLFSLATIAGKRTQFGLTAFFNVKDYDEMIPGWWKKLSPCPYNLCLKLFFEAMIVELDRRWLPKCNTTVAYVFDQTDDPNWRDSISDFFYGVKHLKDSCGRMGSLAFADREKTPQLQAADMLVYRQRQVQEELLFKQENQEQRSMPKGELDLALLPTPNQSNLFFYHKQDLQKLAEELEAIRPSIEENFRRYRSGL